MPPTIDPNMAAQNAAQQKAILAENIKTLMSQGMSQAQAIAQASGQMNAGGGLSGTSGNLPAAMSATTSGAAIGAPLTGVGMTGGPGNQGAALTVAPTDAMGTAMSAGGTPKTGASSMNPMTGGALPTGLTTSPGTVQPTNGMAGMAMAVCRLNLAWGSRIYRCRSRMTERLFLLRR
jgi:hypothetical protein